MKQDYRGVIIEESLADTSVLNDLDIEWTKIVAVKDRHQTPWTDYWTLHSVSVVGDCARDVAEKLAEVLDSTHPWYASFRSGVDHYVIFRDKIFHVNDRSDKKQYEAASRYGRSLGIPEYQLDFSPYVTNV